MKIKICGMKNVGNIGQIASLLPDYLGFIFYDKSKRFVLDTLKPGDMDVVKNNKKVGVFVNEPVDRIETVASGYNLDVIQLHGSETVQECKELKAFGYSIIKTFSVGEAFDFLLLEAYENVVDYFLFDTETTGYGGSGKSFNWQVLENYKLTKPFFLSGGLGLHNVDDLLKFKHPMLHGYDFNSRLETEPGIKEVAAVQLLIEKIKSYERI